MPTLKVAFKASNKGVRVLDASAAVPPGFVNMGTFSHPDTTYPDSRVIYHGVRDLLAARSRANPAEPAGWPDNITNMREITIIFLGTPRLELKEDLLTNLATLRKGSDTRFYISAAGGKAPLVYAWYKNGVAIPSTNSNELVLLDVDAADVGTYHCVVTDANSLTVTSKSRMLQVVE